MQQIKKKKQTEKGAERTTELQSSLSVEFYIKSTAGRKCHADECILCLFVLFHDCLLCGFGVWQHSHRPWWLMVLTVFWGYPYHSPKYKFESRPMTFYSILANMRYGKLIIFFPLFSYRTSVKWESQLTPTRDINTYIFAPCIPECLVSKTPRSFARFIRTSVDFYIF